MYVMVVRNYTYVIYVPNVCMYVCMYVMYVRNYTYVWPMQKSNDERKKIRLVWKTPNSYV
jgi:hypothetical protein